MSLSAGVLGWAAVRQGDGPAAAGLLPGRVRGRSAPGVRMAAQVLEEACARAGVAPGEVPLIHGTGLGEIVTTGALMDMMAEGDGAVSPLRFAVSVHNAAAGQLAIATRNQGFSTTVSAGRGTPAAALLEALTTLHGRPEPVALVLVDEGVPEPLGALGPWEGMAVGLVLGPARDAGEPGVILGSGGGNGAPWSGPVPESLGENPCVDGWRLVQALEAGHRGTLTDCDGAPWVGLQGGDRP